MDWWAPLPAVVGGKTLPSTEDDSTTTTLILLEVVGAMGLSNQRKTHIDPYCVVKVRRNQVHKTSPIQDDGDPIWTVKTKSLCLLEIPRADDTDTPKQQMSAASSLDGRTSEASTERHSNALNVAAPVTAPGAGDTVTIEIFHGNRRLGTVSIFFDEVLKATGQRTEYAVQPTEGSNIRKALLALRFRPAVRDDLLFLGKIKEQTTLPLARPAVASDVDFKEVRRRSLFQSTRKKVGRKELFRVMPYPDPQRPKETEWMTAAEIQKEALKPSVRWVTAGYGTIGTIFVEILGCNNLPNLDMGGADKTDPFVGIAFEDTLVRTDVIWDKLSPRWMPWTTRAYAFQVRHPTSILMLGVFDHDGAPLDSHDPVGRVVINTANFEGDTSYLLHYKLHHDPREEDGRGTIIIRLRIEWKNEGEAMKTALTSPPGLIINTKTGKSFDVLRYLTRGAVDMEKSSLDSVKLYAKELKAYWKNYCFFLDVMVEIFLWRGRLQITKARSVWFPLRSMVLLGAVTVAFERTHLIPTVFFYGIAWIMLSINYHASRHPYPWKRVKASESNNMVVLLGRSIHPPVTIDPGDGVAEGIKLYKLDKSKANRISKLVQAILAFVAKAQKIYSKTSESSIAITTQDNDWSLVAGRLAPIHALLKVLCTNIRLFRALINWKGYYAHSLTMRCVLVGTVWMIFPVGRVVAWVVRFLIWFWLGPWMKLVDVFWAHQYYKTRDELLQDIDNGVEETQEPPMPDFDAWLESDMFIKMGQSGRVVAEDQYKLKDMRERMYGKYSETIPRFDVSRYPSVPLPQSSATPLKEQAKEKEHWYHVPGQKLQGHMILHPEREEERPVEQGGSDDESSGDDDDSSGGGGWLEQ